MNRTKGETESAAMTTLEQMEALRSHIIEEYGKAAPLLPLATLAIAAALLEVARSIGDLALTIERTR